jgi:hypothetical protein
MVATTLGPISVRQYKSAICPGVPGVFLEQPGTEGLGSRVSLKERGREWTSEIRRTNNGISRPRARRVFVSFLANGVGELFRLRVVRVDYRTRASMVHDGLIDDDCNRAVVYHDRRRAPVRCPRFTCRLRLRGCGLQRFVKPQALLLQRLATEGPKVVIGREEGMGMV